MISPLSIARSVIALFRPAKPTKRARRFPQRSPKATDRDALLIRICERIDIDPVTGCWNWQGAGARCGNGRGVIKIDGRQYRLSRVVLMLAGVAFKRGDCALHTCDNPRCIRPDHLWIGTHANNMADRGRKGRTARLWGDVNPQAKLSVSTVLAIRAADGMQAEIAAEYGVSQQHVSDIKLGRSWAHLPAPPNPPQPCEPSHGTP